MRVSQQKNEWLLKRHDAFKDTWVKVGFMVHTEGCFLNTNDGNTDRLSEDKGLISFPV